MSGDGTVAVLGEALIDAHINGNTAQLFPGGSAFNCAASLARLGTPTVFIGGLSRDRLGNWLATTLIEAGATVPDAAFVNAPTPIALVDADTNGVASYEFHLAETALAHKDPGAILAGFDARFTVIHISGLALAFEPTGSQIEDVVERRDPAGLVVLDPNVRDVARTKPGYAGRLERLAMRAGVVKASAEDLGFLFPRLSLGQAAERLLSNGVELAVVTDGANGALAATRRYSVTLPAVTVDVADTIGAGDAFGAALVAALLKLGCSTRPQLAALTSDELRSAVTFASAAGALQCTRRSAWQPTAAELEAFLAQTVPQNREQRSQQPVAPSNHAVTG